ncbi:RagB/SusD family nutrient uptake outer membrane protein [Mucilaginibacter ginsenosidivorans]|uniref:RagB/SusD family nutrient uptake outer membrane protein n=1 Tax=Mucilaginibacter ginsenosidivorans TaxID=398053 RepID=A0A5B8USZ9_9SPHI|nr:RagB/SusD family nutrient uptake outer membrane protein [Mucilaginibacter ginsenosidivorans]QEC62073.1 RagB/SusD family nutrient uptake outer membrane protein [Mucilaginibacter ginsenosidivorans]
MKTYYKSLLLMFLLFSGVSCKKYLNVVPDNTGTLDYAFRNRNEAENYLFTCYATLQQFYDPTANAGFTTSSEIIYPDNLTNHPLMETGFSLIRGTQTSGNVGLNFWDGENGGVAIYRSIRRCNIMLENIDKPIDLSPAEKQRWIAEVKFLKAYYHYYLVRLYGPIPIIKTNLDITASTEAVRVARSPVDSVFSYIVQLLDEAAPNLPAVIDNKAQELGRVTSVIALSVKAEVLATEASPLFNGNPDFSGTKNKNGTPLFSSTYDETKWQKAADAAKVAIDACTAAGLKLYTFSAPAISVPDSLNRVLTIQNAVTEKWDQNPELIWALNGNFPDQGYATPRLTPKSAVNIFSNPSTFAVPISTAELFYTDKGVPLNEDKTFDYNSRYNLQTGDYASRFYVQNGYTTIKEHFDREARFYASIGFDGGIWFGNGKTNINDLYHVEARGNSSLAGPKDLNTLNITGYWPKKLANYLSVYDDGFAPIEFHLPIMRLSGLYLLYAEALNEVNGPTAEAFNYIDKVRARAGLQGVQESWTAYSKDPAKFTTKEGLRAIIHQERRIELCFEGQSGWDLRRWKELQGVLSNPLQGWNIYESEAGNYYHPRTVLIPVFGLKNYLWPIKDNDLIIDNNLVQNPYW